MNPLGDLELVNMVGEYLVEHANLNYVDLQDMVETIQATSYRYSRMKKQVFSNMVRKAYQIYCQQNNLLHSSDVDAGLGAQQAPDSDVELEEVQPVSSVMKNQMTSLYQAPKIPSNQPASKLPFKPAFERPDSLSKQKVVGGGPRGPTQKVPRVVSGILKKSVSAPNDDDDLEIIEEVNGSRKAPLSARNSINSVAPKTSPTPVVLQPKITRNNGNAQSTTTNETTDTSAPSLATPQGNNLDSAGSVNLDQTKQQFQEQRGIKRKALEETENSTPRVRKSTSAKKEKTQNIGLAAGTKKVKRDIAVVNKSSITFSDFGGNEIVVEEICKLLMHLKHPEIYRDLGVIPPRGFLLHGPPGCGKTLLANAIAGELDMPMLKLAATELISGISGESESNIRDLFDQAVSLAPCIIFIDEIDAVTPRRETAQREMERRIVSQMLACIDELGEKENGDQVLLIGATNRIETIDSALRRAGRFDREICLGIPDVKAREQILRILFRNLRLSANFDYSHLARLTPGYVGADLQALMREAAVQTVDKILTSATSSEAPVTNNTLAAVDLETKENAEEADKEGKGNETSSEMDVSEVSEAETQILNETDNTTCETNSYNQAKTQVVSETNTTICETNSDKQGTADESLPSSSNEHARSLSSNKLIENKDRDFLKWIREDIPINKEELGNVCLRMEDFEGALRFVQPSSKREGFATVPDTTWSDIGALTEIREELQVSILGPVKHASAFQSLGLNSPAGVLLCGPPGCGKTLLAKAVANEAGINFISVKGPELLNMYVGESERAVRQCFLRAKNSSPCVIFFDELDALCPRRSDGAEGHNSTSRVVNQLLTEMDGIESRLGVFVMAATNRPDIIDPAILRPGRLDKVIFVSLPTPDDRFDILKAITKNGTLPRFAEDVDLEVVAKSEKLNGFTGADLAAVIREASIAAFRDLVLEPGKNNVPVCADNDLKVFNRHMNTAIARTKPSVTQKDQEKYLLMKERYSSLLSG